MSDLSETDRLHDPDEKRRRALWEPVIARFHENSDPSECEALLASGVAFPSSLFGFFLSAHRGKRLYEKMGRKEKPETFDKAYQAAKAVHEGRRIRDTEGISLDDAFQRVAERTGIDIEKLCNLQTGNCTKKEKIAMRQMKDSLQDK